LYKNDPTASFFSPSKLWNSHNPADKFSCMKTQQQKLSSPCDSHILFEWQNSHNPAAKYFMWKHNKILILLTPSFLVFQVVTLLFQRLLKIGIWITTGRLQATKLDSTIDFCTHNYW
jgi:hypothetical protein